MRFLDFAFCSLLPVLACAQFNPTLWTSYVPLAVRSPYLSAWMNTTDIPYDSVVAAKRAPQLWPSFWNGHTLGWAGHIRVDGTTWKWMGDAAGAGPLNDSLLTNIQITPTQTIMNITAGPVDLTVTWLSPIEPADPVKQSAPFTYVTLVAKANDGRPHDVQVYSDISGEWLSDRLGDVMSWNSQRVANTILHHETFLQTPIAFAESPDIIEDSKVYHVMLLRSDMTWAVDAHVVARSRFGETGVLGNTESSRGSRQINDDFPVFAISVNMGAVDGTTSKPVTWGVSLLRETPITYTTPSGTLQRRNAYWKSQYKTSQDAVTNLLQDYDAAAKRTEEFETTLLTSAANVSPNYADLVALAARQAMAGTELTIGQNSDGSYDHSDVKMFMKDIGTSGRVNPVEVMYAAFPFFLFINASYAGWLLDPVLEFASSSRWPYNYAPCDLGAAYPNATGNIDAHYSGVEQSGNMLIMLHAHAKTSGDGSYISRYYPLLKTWADYLVNNTSPMPQDQVTADLGSGVGSTNLAIKGIIGINAMAQMSAVMNDHADSQYYSTIARKYVSIWKSLALQSGHIISEFGDQNSSWTLPYNLFSHKMLEMDLIDNETFSQEIAFFRDRVSSHTPPILPISSDPFASGNAPWTMFAAAIMTDGTDDSVQNEMIRELWAYASHNSTSPTLPPVSVINVLGPTGSICASPAVGGFFAPLALTLSSKTIRTGSNSAESHTSDHRKGKRRIVGIVVGTVLGTVLLVGLSSLWYWRNHKRRRQAAHQHIPVRDDEAGPAAICTVPHPFDYPQDAPPVPEKTQREVALGAARERGQSSNPDPASSGDSGSQAENIESTAGGNNEDAPGPSVSPEVLRLRNDVDSLRRIIVQAFQPNDRTEPPPEYNEEPRLP